MLPQPSTNLVPPTTGKLYSLSYKILPTVYDWNTSAAQREQYYSKRNKGLKTEFDCKAHTLNQLDIRSTVAIYNTQEKPKKHWQKTGITEVLPYKQIKVKLNGSRRITLHNRRFLHNIISQSNVNSIPSAMVKMPTNPGIINNPKENTPPSLRRVRYYQVPQQIH